MNEISYETVQRAVAGQRDAIDAIMRALERPFYNLALRMLLVPAEAEDAAQECLLRVATRLSQFDGAARFSTWAWRVAVNRILELRRRAPVDFERFAEGLADGLEPEAPERPEDQAILSELKISCGRAMLQCLEPDERIAYVLGEIMDLDGPEAAEILGVEPAAFRKRLSRARERITDALTSHCGVVNPDVPCRCHRRLTRAKALGRVREGERTTEATLDVAALRARLTHHLDQARRAGAYYRADPASLPRRDLVRAALAPLAALRMDAGGSR